MTHIGPGRKTNAAIVESYLQGLDLPLEVLAAIHEADPRVAAVPPGEPGSLGEMRDNAFHDLYDEYKSLKGVAKVQAFKLIDDLARREREDAAGGEKESEPLVADIVGGVGNLSPIRRRQILTEARTRLEEELQAIERVLGEMDAALV